MDMDDDFEARTVTLRAWLDGETLDAADIVSEMRDWLMFFGSPAPSVETMRRLRWERDEALRLLDDEHRAHHRNCCVDADDLCHIGLFRAGVAR